MTYIPLQSMTGFGSSEGEIRIGKLSIDIRSLNHRYLDINIVLPNILQPYYKDVRNTITESFTRGSITCLINLIVSPDVAFIVDKDAIKYYMECLSYVKNALNIMGELDISLLTGLPGVISQQKNIDIDIWAEIESILKIAIERTIDDRKKEGEKLKDLLSSMLISIEKSVEAIDEVYRKSRDTIFINLKDKLFEFLKIEINLSRLEEEAALLVQRSDIKEEIDRLKGHLDFFKENLNAGGACGRKLDFIIQEMNREVNTILSKTQQAEIKHSSIEIKSVIDQMREQVQNIE
ncbi:MAG: YicC/YloC family endoribonuclease [bacterium]